MVSLFMIRVGDNIFDQIREACHTLVPHILALFTSTYDQICDGFLLLLPHLSVAISMKPKTFFHRYIHKPGVLGNNDEIISPHVITINMG
jgi:hypothetical protein